MIKWFGFFSYIVFPSVVFAAVSQMSIAPSESEIQISAGETVDRFFTLQRKDADHAESYIATVDTKEAVLGVSIDAQNITLAQGEIEKEYHFTVQCAQVCSGTGTYAVELVPTTSTELNGVGVVAGIAHKIRIQTVAQGTTTEYVEAATLANLNEDVSFFSLSGYHHFFEPESTIEATLTFENASDVNISHLPYTVNTFIGDTQVSSEQGILSETIPAHDSLAVHWSGNVSSVGNYRYVFSAAGEVHEMVVYVSHIRNILFWLIVVSVAIVVAWFVRPYVKHLTFRGRQMRTQHRFVSSLIGVSALCVVCSLVYFTLPRLHRESTWSGYQQDNTVFALVHDAGKYTIIRLDDGNTDSLAGDWSFFVPDGSHFYAVPQIDSPNTEHRYFYRIFHSEIQPFAADALPSQITHIAENTPGTYAIASGNDFTCIFKTVEPDAPKCDDLAEIVGDNTIRQAEWMDDSGQYVALYLESSDGVEHAVRYDAWNNSVDSVGDYVLKSETTPAADAVDFGTFKPFFQRATITAFDRLYWAPWNTRVVEMNSSLIFALMLAKNGYELSFIDTTGGYYSALPVSSEATIYILRKGTVITSPLISER